MAQIIICADCGAKKVHCVKGLCRPCYHRRYRREHRKERLSYNRQYYQEHREEMLAYHRRYRQENPQKMTLIENRWRQKNPEKCIASMRQWRQENPERVAATKARYREKHRSEVAERALCWQRANPDKKATIAARYRARKHNLPDTLTPGQAEHLLRIGQAIYPGEELQLDHIVPLNKGGGTTLANMHAIPAALNQSKKDALPQEIYRQVELF